MKGFGAGAGPIWVVTVGLLLGCSGAEDPAPNAEPGAESATEAAAAVGLDAPRFEAPPLAQLAPGSVLVSLSEWGVTVRANQVSRRVVLAELERNASLRLKFAPGIRLEELVTIDAIDVPLEEVLGSLLEGLPYALYFGLAPSGERALEQVSVGDFSAADVARVAEAPPERRRGHRLRTRNVERDPAADAERRERRERREGEFYDQLDDDDPAVRAEAAGGLSANDRTIPELSDLALNDPDASVREAAVSALSDASDGNSAALDAAVGALGDPDLQVVISALDTIEWIGDASAIPAIEPLREHSNAEVQDAANSAIYQLQD